VRLARIGDRRRLARSARRQEAARECEHSFGAELLATLFEAIGRMGAAYRAHAVRALRAIAVRRRGGASFAVAGSGGVFLIFVNFREASRLGRGRRGLLRRRRRLLVARALRQGHA